MSRQNIPDNEVWAWNGEVTKPDANRFEKGNESGQTAKPPKHDHFNYEFQRTDENLQYILRNATMPWDKDEKYPPGARVTRGGKEYECIKASTNNDPATSSTYWEWIDNKHLPNASLTQKGIVKLSSSTSSNSESEAATPKAVHDVKETAENAQETANKAVKKAGDTMSGDLGIISLRSSKTSLSVFVPEAESGRGMYLGNTERWIRLFAKEGVAQVFDGTSIFEIFHQGNPQDYVEVAGSVKDTWIGKKTSDAIIITQEILDNLKTGYSSMISSSEILPVRNYGYLSKLASRNNNLGGGFFICSDSYTIGTLPRIKFGFQERAGSRIELTEVFTNLHPPSIDDVTNLRNTIDKLNSEITKLNGALNDLDDSHYKIYSLEDGDINREANVSYTNETDGNIYVNVFGSNNTSSGSNVTLTIDNKVIVSRKMNLNYPADFSFTVPPGSSYEITGQNYAITGWLETRRTRSTKK